MSTEYELVVGGTVDIPGQPPVSIDPTDSPGVFRVGGNPVRPGPAERSIFEWSDLPGTGLEIRYQDGAHPPGSALVRQRGDDPTGTAVRLVDRDQDGYWYPQGRRFPTLADLVEAAVAAGLDPATVRVDHAGCDHCGVGVTLFEPAVVVAAVNETTSYQHGSAWVWDETRGVWPMTRTEVESV